jgi:hypothetical protein
MTFLWAGLRPRREKRHERICKMNGLRKLALISLFFSLLESSGYAQMAPAHGWPTHDYWTAGLFEEAGGIKYCSLMATDRPVTTLQFQIADFKSRKPRLER